MIRLFRLMQLPGWRRALLFEASLFLLLARIQLIVRPFQRLAAGLGRIQPRDEATSSIPTPGQAEAARKVAWAIAVAARNLPFEVVCLPQAIAAKRMLKRRQVESVLHFGVGRAEPEEGLAAHAWVDAAGVNVTGYPVAPQFKEVVRFS